jgi:hypothetical protein
MGHISFVGKLDLDALRSGAPAIAPGFTLEMMVKHSLDFWLTSEDLPDANNRVTFNRQGEIVPLVSPGIVAFQDGVLGFRNGLLLRDPDGQAFLLEQK